MSPTPTFAGFRAWVDRGATDAVFGSRWPEVPFTQVRIVLLTRPAAWAERVFAAAQPTPPQTHRGAGFIRGQHAAMEGLTRTPAHDPAVATYLREHPQPEAASLYLSGWIEGWDQGEKAPEPEGQLAEEEAEYSKSKHAMISWLRDMGWTMLTKDDNPFSPTPTQWRNRLTGEEGALTVVSSTEMVRVEGGYQRTGEDRARFAAPAGWLGRVKVKLAEIDQGDSVRAPTPPAWGTWVEGNEIAMGDIVLATYGNEQRVLRAVREKNRRVLSQIASSMTFRGQRYIQRVGAEARPGSPKRSSFAAPDFTPAKIEKDPMGIVRKALASIDIGLEDGTRIFYQSSQRDSYRYLGRIGGAIAKESAALDDPWAEPLTLPEAEAARSLWEALPEGEAWPWVADVARRATKETDTGAISKAVGDLLRARGVDAKTTHGRGTVHGSVDIRFPPEQRERLESVLAPDSVHGGTASFHAYAAHGDRSDSQSDYSNPGGARLAPDQVQPFLRYYTAASHGFGGRGGRWHYQPTTLGRWVFQGKAPTESGGEPEPTLTRRAPAAGERKPSWISPVYGTVEVVQDAQGQRDSWQNIEAVVGGKRVRFGYNGKRWAKKTEPPAGLLAEVADHGYGELFGEAARPAAPTLEVLPREAPSFADQARSIKESKERLWTAVLARLVDLGWEARGDTVGLVLAGGYATANNPKGLRRFLLDPDPTGLVRVTHGDNTILIIDPVGETPEEMASTIDQAVRGSLGSASEKGANSDPATYRDLFHFLHDGMISRYTREVADAFGMGKKEAYQLLHRLEARKGKRGGWSLSAEQSTPEGVGTRGQRRYGEKSVGEELLWILSPTIDEGPWEVLEARMVEAGEPLLDQALPGATKRPAFKGEAP